MSKTNQPVQHTGSQCSGGTKLQPPLSTAMFYCYNYNILTVYNKEHPPVGTQPQPFRSGPTWPNSTRIQKMLWNRETVQVKLPGFRNLEIGNKPVTQLAQQPCHSTISVDSMAQNYHPNPHSQKRNLQQMRTRVSFRLVWDFRARPFSLFLGSFLGAKRARFLTPFEVSVNPTGKLPKSLEIGKGLVWFQPVSARNSAFFLTPKTSPNLEISHLNLLKSAPDFANREPVGNQSGKSAHRPQRHEKCQTSTKKVPKPCKNQHFCAFWGGARIFPTGSRLVPDWFWFPISKKWCWNFS